MTAHHIVVDIRTNGIPVDVKPVARELASARNKAGGDFYRADGSLWRRVLVQDGEPIEFILRGPYRLENFRVAPLFKFVGDEERKAARAWHTSEIDKRVQEACWNGIEEPERPAAIDPRPSPWRRFWDWLATM